MVVPSVNGLGDLADCLTALEAERASVRLEVLVPDRLGPPLRAELARRFPWVTVLPASAEATIPDLRALAFTAASAPVVAVIEDHVLVPRGWARQLLEAVSERSPVVGGAVENAATGTLVDWASFLCEYAHLLPPLPAGPVAGITGNNTAYRRDLLVRYRPVIERGGWEDQLHAAMAADGIPLTCRPEIRVGHRKHFTVAGYASQRFLYSRAFAGARLAGAGPLRRGIYGLAALGLPPVLLARVVSAVWRKGRHRGVLVRSLPLLAVFVTAWAAGEVAGAWFGPGDALRRVT